MEGITALTFDCYGTLIDWDGGIRAAVGRVKSVAGCDLEQLLIDRERADVELTAGPYRPYDDVLRESLRIAAGLQGRKVLERECAAFAESMAEWPPFDDSPAALHRLRRRFRLAILSNVRRAVLERSAALLDAQFDALVSAEELCSYKPARAHFDEGLRRLGLPPSEVLHVACSLYHDIGPADALGWRTAWIDRRREGPAAGITPTIYATSLAELAQRLER